MRLRRAYPIYLGHFVSPPAPLVSAHEVGQRALFCGTAEPEQQEKRGIDGTQRKSANQKSAYWIKEGCQVCLLVEKT